MSRRGLLAYGHRDSISQDQWGKPRLVRSNTMPGGSYARSAIAPAPSKSRGKRVLRSVVVFFSRPKRGKMTSKSAALTEPASPVSTQLSRSSSATSSRQSGEDGGRSERRVSTRARVSFNPEVTTVTIEQMNAEEVSNTFYCRTEYAAFKEAYRTHRDTSTGWCRSNDVLPCNCDACQDDLVEGVELMESPCGKEEEDYDSAFEDSEPERLPSSSHSIDDLEIVLHINEEDDDDDDQDNLDSQDILEIHDILDSQDILDCHDILDSQEDSQDEAPLSPGGAVFQDADDRSNGAIDDSAEEEASPVRPDLLRTRGSSWGAGGEPLPGKNAGGSHHRRGGSLDDWGGKASVQDAVRCHGPEYAYKTLRLQGFSDLYIKTHFLPEGSPIGSCR